MLRQRGGGPGRGVDTDLLVLEVVHGPRAGARLRLEADRPLRIGHAWDNDVVLRDPSTAGVCVRLERGPDGAVVEVESGTVALLGVALEPGRPAVLPRWTPLAIGDALVAVGPDDEGAWRACRRLARASVAARRPALPGPSPAADRPLPVGGVGVLARARRRWPLAAVALALPVLVAAVWLAQPVGPTRPAPERAASTDAVRAWLSAEGFGQLRVQRAASGPPVVDGLVDHDADRARIAAGLAAAGLTASLDLASGEQIARQVADVLRLNGVRAEVRHMGRGVVQARLHEPDAERRARAEAAARRDIRGLASLAVEIVETGPARPAAPAALDPSKRVVTIVYGPGGYVVTADGARYFEGALLPSGHRIARIEARDVELERDGRTSRLAL
ncbi:MAG: hypothetical protein RJA99_3828 [Pseudomonadota bacterium]|jgi:type III secretion protein D